MTKTFIEFNAASLDGIEDRIFTNDRGSRLSGLVGYGRALRTDDADSAGGVNDMG